MFIAGLNIPDHLVLDLAFLVENPELAGRLEEAYDLEIGVLGLSIEERGEILAALDDPPDELRQLRAVLLAEHVGRVRSGLV